MAINPAQTDTITIPELETDTLNSDSLIPFSNPEGRMKKARAQDVASLITVAASPAFSNNPAFRI